MREQICRSVPAFKVGAFLMAVVLLLAFKTMAFGQETLKMPSSGVAVTVPVDPPVAAAKPAIVAPKAETLPPPVAPTFHTERQCFTDRLGRTRCMPVTVQDGATACTCAPGTCTAGGTCSAGQCGMAGCGVSVGFTRVGFLAAPVTYTYTVPATACATCGTSAAPVAVAMSRHDARVAARIERRAARRGE